MLPESSPEACCPLRGGAGGCPGDGGVPAGVLGQPMREKSCSQLSKDQGLCGT